MLIVADEEIPCVEHYFGSYGDIIYKNGRSLTRSDVKDADILLVRSVTKINEALLQNTHVKFVGSTVAGTDHLDIPWLTQKAIRWSAASGCNALAVAEYVVIVIAALQTQGLLLQKKCRAGVVGVGRVGSKVVEKLKLLGFEVVQCDPIRAEQEKDFISTSLEKFENLDLILLHTPLTREQPYPTFHMIEKSFLQRQKEGCVLLSAGRGSVVDFTDLVQYGQHLVWCLDVWENEPFIDKKILQNTTIASPHIAGHSVQSKYRGVQMVYKAALQQGVLMDKKVEDVSFPRAEISFHGRTVDWREIVLAIFNPLEVTHLMKSAYLKEGDNFFDVLRKRFKRGHEFEYVNIKDQIISQETTEFLQSILFHL